ncbi:MAG: protein translocase subunit SecF [bacterium]|nr:protein translocase subunit SecF [bacterium]MDO8742773.1 protein translocase subunit SecF [bacterium]
MYIIQHRALFFWITGIILAIAIGSIAYFGLPLGIDFTGGSLMQVKYSNGVPSLQSIEKQVLAVPLETVSVRSSGTDAVSIRTRTLTPAEHDAVFAAVSANASTTELAYTSVGPSLGSEFAHKALWAIFAVVLVIALYIAFAFRKVSRPVSSWYYGFAVIVILIHDLIIPAGFFAALAHYTNAQVDALFITALLALLGYSVNDTIIIYDRVRENLMKSEKVGLKESFEDTIGKSISETMTRSINMSLTVVLALGALVLFGAAATRDFSLVMLVGVISGTYSSILLAAPLLVPIARRVSKN